MATLTGKTQNLYSKPTYVFISAIKECANIRSSLQYIFGHLGYMLSRQKRKIIFRSEKVEEKYSSGSAK
jgi:hypothetical protein